VTVQVVIPSFNQGPFIGEAIRSVLDQSADVDVELVVVDACSDDDTEQEIERALATPHRAQVTVIREPDDGQSDAINKGVDRGTGEIVSWLNADDSLFPGALASVEQFFVSAGGDVAAVYGDLAYVDVAGRDDGIWRSLSWRFDEVLWGPGYIPQPATFVRRTAWQAVGGVRTDLHYVMDIDLWLRLSRHGRLEYRPGVLARFRRHAAQKTSADVDRMHAEHIRVIEDHAREVLGRSPTPLEIRARRTLVRARRRGRAAVRDVASRRRR
jgi:glycosyltransferase involved in cell wall biosynthesis